ncbi:estrogen sulfotransferase-like [Ostrea edulis]|uniref:estrogen sulfotransferase-like n=1 Tax=Ostrea edulis TaxID=37623 RepID=UPI0024AFCDAB|nr:estrogen sulfotransferase-like [Ostrea edulis]
MNPRAFVFNLMRNPILLRTSTCRLQRIDCIWLNRIQRQVRYYQRSHVFNQGKGSPKQGDKYVFPFRTEARRKGLLNATYGSLALGLCILGTIFYSKVILSNSRRRKGFSDVKDDQCSKANMVLFKDTVLPNFAEKKMQDISEFGVRENDIWIIGYPRSGMTWIQEIVFLVQTLDFEASCAVDSDERIPYLEFPTTSLQDLANKDSPRIIKTHLPLRLLPEEINKIHPKIVYIARNPKDVVVSYFHLVSSLRSITRYNGKLTDFVDSFLKDRVPYSPWSRHVLEFWEIKDQPSILFLTYEDMTKDLEGSIKKVAAFLQRDLTTEDVQRIAKHCSFDEMKKNPAVNHQWMNDRKLRDLKGAEFLRHGKVGSWQNQLSAEQDKRMNVKIALKLRDSGLLFQYSDEGV